MKFHPSEKKTTESKKSKNQKVQVEALSKQKMPDLDVRVHDSKGAPQSDPVSSNNKKNVFKSRRQSNAEMGKLTGVQTSASRLSYWIFSVLFYCAMRIK